ncbi:NapC/NirT family cytochrome c [Anaerobacillus isosaccharinicus]|uniref:NapC/NirT family cytochrome c n=1 Tax=Anaerobacillus isosaccharinicus TaxID=1532552 RepID=A0A1S2LRB5_9BACI|nr:NapC/NirT family cytochrome c [Anaerobacillus isosaccharinicus]MBA5585432.1 NapC/NirT family cytochrome c [Anaerobacillus isosaccharinicus]QOY36250.1 NapC/NirT family cytochrome c [Anaerobacillus isosaccharinicus]
MEKEQSLSKKLKIIKFMTVLIIIIVGAAFILKIGVHATSSSSFCANCHSMKPQVLTWEASSHSQVECVQCHVQPGLENLAKQKAGGIKQLYHTITDNYIAPIRMPSYIPNESCTACHNMSNRDVSTSGDIVIDHDIHETKEVACVTCHDGVAHGKVSEKRVTYKSDYQRWNETLAKRFMKDEKSVRPVMSKCMDCHELRGAPLTCETCHTTGMLPETHEEDDFLKGKHGNLASQDLMYCESCHSYMSKNPIKEFREQTNYMKYINSDTIEKLFTVQQYAKTNTYCITCHSVRPNSHNDRLFLMNHGRLADETKDTCFTCHENQAFSETPVTNISCSSCHPSNHKSEWKRRHPVPIPDNQKFEKTCLNCHVETTCTKCHTVSKREGE